MKAFYRIIIIYIVNLFITSLKITAQSPDNIINKYTKVISIDSCANSVSVINTNGFSPNSKVLIIQMQGAEINKSDTENFGSIIDIAFAGNYEFAEVLKVNNSEITFKNKLLRNYDPEGSVQLITVPQYSSYIVNIVNTPTAAPWNGNVGGVLVFEVNSLILNSDINVSGKGFRGGILNTSQHTPCNLVGFVYSGTDNSGAGKGEGIVKASSKIERGKGAIANGGGSGNSQNSGGGGGGNGGVGGYGGYDYNGVFCNYKNNTNTRGVGGYQVSYPNLNKIFLGGGGGSGHQNNDNGTPGASGGGIIIIKAESFTGNNNKIVSNGLSALTAADDGSGGGGAGGTILLNVENFVSPVALEVNGGNGGNNNGTVNNSYCFGPGGGGSGGAIYTSKLLPSNQIKQYKGGSPGIMVYAQSRCFNTTYGATSGMPGTMRSNFVIPESSQKLETCNPSVDLPSDINNIIIPNIITPNKDGMNDVFEIKGVEISEQLELKIYNRWGQEVFTTINYQNNWNGDGLSSGIYYYFLQIKKYSFKGWIEVTR